MLFKVKKDAIDYTRGKHLKQFPPEQMGTYGHPTFSGRRLIKNMFYFTIGTKKSKWRDKKNFQ